jgi:hypothetical protein
MADQYDNTNSGALWKSKFTDNPRAPQYTGTLDVEGVEYKISAWKSTGENPRAPVLNFKIQKDSDMPNIPKPNNDRPLGDVGGDGEDDDVPF